MAVSRLTPSSGANDFNVQLTSIYSSIIFDKEYAAGSYTITSSLADSTYDIYAYSSNGSLAGYTKTPALSVTSSFNKLVILGGTSGDLLSFSYKTTYASVDDSDEVTAGPVAASITPSSLPNVNDTAVITGRNFATNVAVTFTSANTAYSATSAKNIVRSSVTSLIVTRPDNLPTTFSPYTVTVSNPGVTNPTGSNAHILSNSITAGASPVWVTSATLPTFTRNSAYSTTVQATDADGGSSITYSIASGALPTGFTLVSTSGVISGTTTSAASASVTIRATDSGGNFVDRAFTIPNTGPVWVTTASSVLPISGQAFSYTLQATDDSGVTPTFALVSGTLPSGLSFNSGTGVISGTTTDSTSRNVTFSATDSNGTSANLVIPMKAYTLQTLTITATTSFTPLTNTIIDLAVVGGGGGAGGTYGYSAGGSGGAGGGGVATSSSVSVTAGTPYTITIGAAGTGATNTDAQTGGGDSSAFGIIGYGGNRSSVAGSSTSQSVNGPGSGEGTYGFGGVSVTGWTGVQGSRGKQANNFNEGGGGGGATAGTPSNGGTGVNGVSAFTYGTFGGGGGGGSSNGNQFSGGSGGGGQGQTGTTDGGNANGYGGGGGGVDSRYSARKGGNGFQGVVIFKAYQ